MTNTDIAKRLREIANTLLPGHHHAGIQHSQLAALATELEAQPSGDPNMPSVAWWVHAGPGMSRIDWAPGYPAKMQSDESLVRLSDAIAARDAAVRELRAENAQLLEAVGGFGEPAAIGHLRAAAQDLYDACRTWNSMREQDIGKAAEALRVVLQGPDKAALSAVGEPPL